MPLRKFVTFVEFVAERISVGVGVISGVVRSKAGAPVEMARVFYSRTPAPVPDIAALTGADGSFSLDAPADGVYTVKIVADGYAEGEASVEVRQGASVPSRRDALTLAQADREPLEIVLEEEA